MCRMNALCEYLPLLFADPFFSFRFSLFPRGGGVITPVGPRRTGANRVARLGGPGEARKLNPQVIPGSLVHHARHATSGAPFGLTGALAITPYD